MFPVSWFMCVGFGRCFIGLFCFIQGSSPVYSYSIITVEAEKSMKWLHDRMPVSDIFFCLANCIKCVNSCFDLLITEMNLVWNMPQVQDRSHDLLTCSPACYNCAMTTYYQQMGDKYIYSTLFILQWKSAIGTNASLKKPTTRKLSLFNFARPGTWFITKFTS